MELNDFAREMIKEAVSRKWLATKGIRGVISRASKIGESAKPSRKTFYDLVEKTKSQMKNIESRIGRKRDSTWANDLVKKLEGFVGKNRPKVSSGVSQDFLMRTLF